MITLVVFVLGLLIGMPIIFLLILGGVVFMAENGILVLLDSLPVQAVRGISANGFLAIPLYMLVGELMHRGGITDRLLRLAERVVGRLRHGLALVNIVANVLAAAILGSATAQIAVMTRTIVPAMISRGHAPGFATGMTVTAGLLGPVIPPSMSMIIYGVVAYQSVATLFIAGIVPGLIIAAGLLLVTILLAAPEAERSSEVTSGWRPLLGDLLPALIPLIIIAGIVSGATTPTEAGAVACLVAFILAGPVYRQVSWHDVPGLLASVAMSSAAIIALIGFATFFGWALTFQQVPDLLVSVIERYATGDFTFLLLTSLIIFILGMFLDGIGIMIVLVPVLLPVADGFGVDPIHFGVVVALATLTGLVTPPVGPGLFIAMEATRLPMPVVFRGAVPFLATFVIVLGVIAGFPARSTALPSWLGL
jgi:tripartite ATP-independent transporter DctM subunit